MEMEPTRHSKRLDPEAGLGYANKGFKRNSGSFGDMDTKVDTLNEAPVSTKAPASPGTFPVDDPVHVYIPEPLEDDENPNACNKCVTKVTHSINNFFSRNSRVLWRMIYCVLVLFYVAYFIYAMYYSFGDEGSVRLLWVTCLVIFMMCWHFASKHLGDRIGKSTESIEKHSELISWVIVGIIWLAVIIYTIVDVAVVSKNPYNLVSLAGIIIYVIIMFIFSVNPGKVRWRTVAWGLALQFIFAILILRWTVGYQVFQWLGARVTEFLAHTYVGARFLFGNQLVNDFVVAFNVLPVVVFFSSAISILYYLGIMQVVIQKLASIMQVTMATTAAESLSAAGNIFVGSAETPLMIRPLLDHMTLSELHAVMTGGFATIAGSVLGAFISFGIPANHLLSASVMSAPAALAIAKLSYPETQKSKNTVKDVQTMEKSDAHNIVEAASAGASASITLVAHIAVNLIAALSLVAFLNASLQWFGARIGFLPPGKMLDFELIASYLLWPFAFVMGIEAIDCLQVAYLLGLKIFVGEFITYGVLATMTKNGNAFNEHLTLNGTYSYSGNNILLHPANGTDIILSTLSGGIIYSERSLVITTYALCGFSSITSIGIAIGSMSAIVPHRRADIAKVAVRAMIAGTVASYTTACIAGVFYDGNIN